MSVVSEPLSRKGWFSAAELAQLRLPCLPTTAYRVTVAAQKEGWPSRARAASGGGREYPVSALPFSARIELVRRGLAADGPPDTDGLEPRVAEGLRRARVLEMVERFRRAVGTTDWAVRLAAEQSGMSSATIWRWWQMVRAVAREDWPETLAPRRRGPSSGTSAAEMPEQAWELYKSDWLRLSRPTHASCYRRVRLWAEAEGVAIPGPATFRRRLAREVPREVVIAMREGREALREALPAQERTIAALEAMSLVNVDGHRWDVFVAWPDGRVIRPVMVTIQDVYSRKILAWRIGDTESAVLTRLAFADLFRDWGVPDAVLLDNGRAFASKWITGGAPTRYRFKVRPEEPLGLLTQLGIRNHWATPYRGQSKPVERAFRDFCDAIAKHPAFEGAWTGNRPDAKPENYASRAVPLSVFEKVVAAGIAEHNSRPGRRTEAAAGRSFDAAFAASYERAQVRKASGETMRRALLAAERVRADRRTGEIRFLGNRYWRAECGQLAGQLLTIRFDPQNLHGGIHLYDAGGRYLFAVPVWEAAGFLDADAARARARLEADFRRTTKRLIELENLLSPAELAARLPDHPDEIERPRARVVRPVRLLRGGADPVPEDPEERPETAFVDRFAGAVSRLRLVGEG